MTTTRAKLTLSMIVRNEADRYLRRALSAHRPFIDAAVIIDDGSTDDTVAICRELLADIPLTLVENEHSLFSNEVVLRKQQWEATVQTQPDWILNLDADEVLEPQAEGIMADLLHQTDVDAYYFRLYDMWSDTHYRDDSYWLAHNVYRPFLVRYQPEWTYSWKDMAQHCGRFPLEVHNLAYACHPLRIKHYGWADLNSRKHKYERYRRLDPEGRYGWPAQYESILDPDPHLVAWQD